jgi:hypothetical protein
MMLAVPASSTPRILKGQVSSQTHQRVYLDHGADAGLAVGTQVRLRERRRTVGRCVVDAVTSSTASCTLKSPIEQVVHRFRARVERPAPVAAGGEPSALVPQPRKLVAGATEASGFAKVDFDAPSRAWRPRVRPRSEVAVSYRGAHTGLDVARTMHRARLSVGVYGAEVYVPGLRLRLSATVDGAFSPPGARFRQAEIVRLQLHEAALAFRHPSSVGAFAVGRFVPWQAPGLGPIDGGLAALTLAGGAIEVGAYGGLMPSTTLLRPELSRPLGGGYWSLRYGDGGLFVWHRGRVGVVSSLAGSARAEGEAHVAGRYGRWVRAAAGARAGAGIDGMATLAPSAGLDLAYADATLTPGFGVRTSASYRYVAPYAPRLSPGTWPSLVEGAHHIDASFGWNPADWLDVTARTGAFVGETWTMRGLLAVEGGAPRLLDDRIGVAAGWVEALGVPASRMLYTRASVRPGFGAFSSMRLYYVDQARKVVSAQAVGGELRFEERWGFFSAWASGRAEVPLPSVLGFVQPTLDASTVLGEAGLSASF